MMRGPKQIEIGDPVQVRRRTKRAELAKKRDRLSARIEYLDRQIAEHPKAIERYEAARAKHEAGEDTLFPFMCDPRKLYGREQ